MLLSLTQRNPGGGAILQQSQTVLVGVNQILWVEPAGGTGASVHLAGGRRVDVLEDPDQVLDAMVHARDEGWQKKAMGERKKARDERQQAEAKRAADLAHAQARAAADAAHAEAERHRVVAEGARRRADAVRAAAAEGKPLSAADETMTPDGRPRQSPQIPAGLIGPATVGNVEGSVQGAPTGIGTADAGKEGEPTGPGGLPPQPSAATAAKSDEGAADPGPTPPLPAGKAPHGGHQQTTTSPPKSGKSSKG